MQIVTGNKTIDYSVTPNGSFMRVITLDNGNKIIHSGKSTSKMLGLMMYDEAEKMRAEFIRKFNLMKAISFWEMHDETTITGSFNTEHYQKVLKAKGLECAI